MKRVSFTPLCFSFLLSASGILLGQSQAIIWGSELSGGRFIDSRGDDITLGDGSFTDGGFAFELGTFAAGFEPTAANTSDWVANWRVFDAVVAADEDPMDAFFALDATTSAFSAVDDVTFDGFSLSGDSSVSSGADFTEGEQGYVFVRNSNDTTAGSEWLLYTNEEWTFPFVAEESHAPLLVEWLIEGSDEAVFGAVNDTIVGAGERSSIETNFLAQTFTFVPEPSSLSLLLLGGLLTLRRERKSV